MWIGVGNGSGGRYGTTAMIFDLDMVSLIVQELVMPLLNNLDKPPATGHPVAAPPTSSFQTNHSKVQASGGPAPPSQGESGVSGAAAQSEPDDRQPPTTTTTTSASASVSSNSNATTTTANANSANTTANVTVSSELASYCVEVYKMLVLLMEHVPYALRPFKRELFKVSLCQFKAEDAITRQWSYAIFSRFISENDLSLSSKAVSQVYVYLLRANLAETTTGKDVIRLAIDTLMPALLTRQSPEDLLKVMKYTNKTLSEEIHANSSGHSIHSLPQLCHVWHVILRFRDVFYHFRGLLVPVIINSVMKLGLSSSSTADVRIASVAIAEMIIDWELHPPSSTRPTLQGKPPGSGGSVGVPPLAEHRKRSSSSTGLVPSSSSAAAIASSSSTSATTEGNKEKDKKEDKKDGDHKGVTEGDKEGDKGGPAAKRARLDAQQTSNSTVVNVSQPSTQPLDGSVPTTVGGAAQVATAATTTTTTTAVTTTTAATPDTSTAPSSSTTPPIPPSSSSHHHHHHHHHRDAAAVEKELAAADSFALNKGSVQILANFLIRMSFLAVDNKDASVARLSPRCLRLFAKLGALPLMHTVNLPYFEKMLQNTLDTKREPNARRDRGERVHPGVEVISDSAIITCLELTTASLSSNEQGPNPHLFEAHAELLTDLTPYIFDSESVEVGSSFLRLLHKIFTIYPISYHTPTFLDESGYLQTLLDHVEEGLTVPASMTMTPTTTSHTPGGSIAGALVKEIQPMMFALQCVNTMCQAQPSLVEVFGTTMLKNAHQLLAEHVAKAVRLNPPPPPPPPPLYPISLLIHFIVTHVTSKHLLTTLSTYPIKTPSHYTLSTYPIKTPSHYTLSTYPIKTPSHYTLSSIFSLYPNTQALSQRTIVTTSHLSLYACMTTHSHITLIPCLSVSYVCISLRCFPL